MNTPDFADPDARHWQAVLDRAPSDTLYAVTTQGVFCRTGCPSRPPLRGNTRFFADVASAEAAGFRACKRCDPKGERAALHAAAVAAACQLIEQEDTMPSLARLADHAGYARHHFLRMFRDITGVTPRSYAENVRARRLSSALANGSRVVDAVLDAGYGSESRVYGQPSRVLGMTPGAARRGGAGEVIRAALADSALGPLLVGATERGICFIGFGEDEAALRGDLAARFSRAEVIEADDTLRAMVQQVVDFCAEPRAALALPLDLRGTAFQRQVWEGLQRIPFGETTHYAAFAASLGRPDAVRAVARAIASNPVSLAVPCHRVLGKGGDLTGYRWGVERKRAILAGEKSRRA
ncbi:bifunctional DNA-binding transcriptional regulator/O6-methylguanine-DNA methyltransferase Ada [Plastoroseomonas arctica]|nr:bifunctional DNA-binding transcriptional regulator/O6-methylguanine-DNA methyltransferase Ada [Plastoroseomonas arctica]